MPRRLRPKELKAPDEFVTTTARVAAWVRKHRREAGVLLTVVLLAAAGWGGWRVLSERRGAALRAAFNAATAPYEEAILAARGGSEGNFREALVSLDRFAAEHPDNLYTPLIHLYRGTSLRHLAQREAAITALSEVLRSRRASSVTRIIAYQGLGAVYEEQRDFARAADAYERMAAEPSPLLRDVALASAARAYERLGDAEKARRVYDRLVREFPVSPAARAARERLAVLDVQKK